MKTTCTLGVLLMASCLHAQTCDPGGGALSLRFNGTTPSGMTAQDHVVSITSPIWTISITNGMVATSTPFLLLAGSTIVCESRVVPWGGSVDVDPISILLDGFFGATPFDLAARSNWTVGLPIPCSFIGLNGPSLQAIFQDTTAAPFFLNNTTAGQPLFATTATSSYSIVADDGFIAHQLVCPMTFGGIAYTRLFVGSNGQITFETGSTSHSPLGTTFVAGFQNGPTPPSAENPGVAVFWADYFRPSTVNDRIDVVEDRTAGTVLVQWIGVEWYNSQAPAGSFSAKFGQTGPNSLIIDLSGTIAGSGGPTPGIGTNDPDPLVGVTDGKSTVGTDMSADFSALLAANAGTFTTPLASAPLSIFEQFPLSGGDPMQPLDLMTLTFEDPTGTFQWTIH